MREILFRGKRVDNGEWVEGLIARIGEMGISNIVEKQFDILVPVKTETVGQFTGLTDKNGVKIFENDIIRIPNKGIFKDLIMKVQYNDGCFDVIGINKDFRDYLKCWVCNHALEIIGNIFDNSELLEDK